MENNCMEARLKNYLPQEGTGGAGESLPEKFSGSPTYSGGGTVLRPNTKLSGVADQASEAENTTGFKKQMVQQTLHKSLFNTRPRANSLNNLISGLQTNEPSTSRIESTPPQWQRVPMLRNHKRQRTSESPPKEISLENRFSSLSTDVDMPGPSDVTKKKENKPPPLILYGIEDVNKLFEAFETVMERTEYSLKIITKNQLRVNCTTVESYKKLMTFVRQKGLIGHTFTRKEERPYRIVIKNLHHTTPHDAIRTEIEKSGNKVRGEIINARIGPNKRPTTTFFVNIEPGTNNKAVKDIRVIYNTIVTIEDPKKRKVIAQCTKCQQYGHTKNNCLRPYRCVKCAEAHNTTDCPKKDRNSPAKCALCLGSHPANYKGCEVYKEILSRKYNVRKPEPLLQYPTEKNKKLYNKESRSLNVDVDEGESTRQYAANTRTYSEVLRNERQYNVDSTKVVELLIKQSEKIDILLQQISNLMGLMTKLVDKLVR